MLYKALQLLINEWVVVTFSDNTYAGELHLLSENVFSVDNHVFSREDIYKVSIGIVENGWHEVCHLFGV